MRMAFVASACAAFAVFAIASSPVLAQQKTVKACQEEWRANKAANQAKGITEKAYVAQCRAGGATATTPPRPSATPAAAPATAPRGAAKTVKACEGEWRANKAGYQAAGITEKAYVEKCRAGEAVALPSATPAQPAPAPSVAAPPAQAPRPTARPPAVPTTVAPAGANQFQTEAQAKARCPSDLVVWANLRSKIYHFSGHKSYGQTKEGAYMCERDATAQGFRASRTEKRPAS